MRRDLEVLDEAAKLSRRNFHGPVTYTAAFWEQVDWARFDVVGVNLYRLAGNESTYAMPDFPHRVDDPEHDLDMAGFGVVKVAADDPSRWERKAAFYELARLYATQGASSRSSPSTERRTDVI